MIKCGARDKTWDSFKWGNCLIHYSIQPKEKNYEQCWEIICKFMPMHLSLPSICYLSVTKCYIAETTCGACTFSRKISQGPHQAAVSYTQLRCSPKVTHTPFILLHMCLRGNWTPWVVVLMHICLQCGWKSVVLPKITDDRAAGIMLSSVELRQQHWGLNWGPFTYNADVLSCGTIR